MESPRDHRGATVKAIWGGVLALMGLVAGIALMPTAANAADDFPARVCSEFGVTPPPVDQKDTKGQLITPKAVEGKKPVPVILVHGWNGAASTFSSPINLFADTGDGGDGVNLPFSFIGQLQNTPGLAVYTFDYSTYSNRWVTDSNIGPRLAQAIQCLTDKYGAKAQIVAHSMGGLATRYALSQNDSSGAKISTRVSGVSTFGTPNTGSDIAAAVAAAMGLNDSTPPTSTSDIAGERTAGWLLANACGRQITAVGADALIPPCDKLPGFVAGFDSDGARAMRAGSSQLASLPAWPSGIPVTAVDGSTRIHGLTLFGVGGSDTGIDAGDLLVSTKSATAGSTTTRELSCGYALVATNISTLLFKPTVGTKLISDGPIGIRSLMSENPCFHANLLRTINGTNVAAEAVRSAITSPQPTQTKADTGPTDGATSGPGWYSIRDIQPISSGNGLDYKKTLTIRNTPFPDSLLGYYSTGKYYGDPDQRTYGLKGLCTKFEVYVGQSADSPGRVGPSTFTVTLDGQVAATVQRVYLDEPQKIALDVTGITRIEIQDERTNSTGGFNVWGSPRFYCSTNPSPK